MKRYRSSALGLTGALAMACAIAALGRRDSFLVILLYVACTMSVGAAATIVTIRGIARLGRQPDGSHELGLFEAGFLIGLFIVAPLALSGAFAILGAVVGSP